MNKNKGISLIVLIVTIIVIIILAAVVFLTISKNNPIESAKEARFKEDVRTFQDELALSVSKEYTAKAGQRDNKFTATKFSKIQKYIPSFNKNYEGKFVIKQDELVYKTENLTEKELEMVQNLNVRENIKTSAEIIEEDANTAYGANVTNYSSNGVSEWKIFYSDGQHVYLISSKYIDVNKLPATKNGYKPENCNAEYPKTANFDNVLKDYNGSPDITDERLKELNYDYFVKGYSSNDNNMKAVAYMLDIDIWSIFARGKNAEYAIGGPTIEMVFNSYNQKYDKSYISKVFENEIGYKISVDGGNNYGAWYAWILNNDPLYVLQEKEEISANEVKTMAMVMWIASPSSVNKYLLTLTDTKGIGTSATHEKNNSFRPVVCLKSDAVLTKVSDTEYRID